MLQVASASSPQSEQRQLRIEACETMCSSLQDWLDNENRASARVGFFPQRFDFPNPHTIRNFWQAEGRRPPILSVGAVPPETLFESAELPFEIVYRIRYEGSDPVGLSAFGRQPKLDGFDDAEVSRAMRKSGFSGPIVVVVNEVVSWEIYISKKRLPARDFYSFP